MNSPVEYNPYEPPTGERGESVDSSAESWQLIVDRFRRETHALAGLTFFFACLSAAVVVVAVARQTDVSATLITGMVGGSISTGPFVLGVQIAVKKMMALRILLILAYGMLLAVLPSIPYTSVFGIFGAIWIGFIVSQIHRVLRNSGKMVAAGIPLNKKPDELFADRLKGLWNPPR